MQSVTVFLLVVIYWSEWLTSDSLYRISQFVIWPDFSQTLLLCYGSSRKTESDWCVPQTNYILRLITWLFISRNFQLPRSAWPIYIITMNWVTVEYRLFIGNITPMVWPRKWLWPFSLSLYDIIGLRILRNLFVCRTKSKKGPLRSRGVAESEAFRLDRVGATWPVN